MKPILFALLSLFILSPMALAQEASSAADAPAEADAPEAPAAPEPDFTSEAFGDWELRCAASGENCFLYQLAKDNTGNPVSEITVLSLPEDSKAQAGITAVTPLGTALTEGLVLQVDGGQARKYEFGWCTEAGCFVRFGMENDYLQNWKAGNVVKIRVVSVSAPEQPIVLDLSLSGFTKAFNALKAK